MTDTAVGVITLDQRMTAMEVSFAAGFATLSTKLDGLVDQVAALSAAMTTDHIDHEARLRVLEQRPAPDDDLKDHERRLRDIEARPVDDTIPGRVTSLEKFRWVITGAAAAGGGILGGAISAALSAIGG